MLYLTTYRAEAWRTYDRRDAVRTAREIRAEAPEMATRLREIGSRWYIQLESTNRRGWYASAQPKEL